ncbi:MAG: M48 family metalloprotease, partial [Pyrinomonadaceae bacterium]|nr:M48 family metalloprotease [Pyrinomonadaceae bacterium]
RHGTAQATKAEKYQYGAIAGAILGSVIGGGLGNVVGQGSQAVIGTYFLKFSREYETEADILGAQIMARAGYDPRDLANMFRTLQQQGGGGGPEFLSDHPNPANRLARINQEAALLRVSGDRASNNGEFARVQSRLRSGGRAASMEEIARNNGQRYPHGGNSSDYPTNARVGGRVAYPSGRYRTYTEGNDLLRVSVPENWQRLPSQSSVWYVPEGGYGQGPQGNAVFTHGTEIGFSGTSTGDLRRETEQFLNELARSNQNMRQQSGLQNGSISGRQALAMTFSNVNEVTGQREIVTVYTALTRNGSGLFHMISVAPENDYRQFQSAFDTILRSVRLSD